MTFDKRVVLHRVVPLAIKNPWRESVGEREDEGGREREWARWPHIQYGFISAGFV